RRRLLGLLGLGILGGLGLGLVRLGSLRARGRGRVLGGFVARARAHADEREAGDGQGGDSARDAHESRFVVGGTGSVEPVPRAGEMSSSRHYLRTRELSDHLYGVRYPGTSPRVNSSAARTHSP